MSHQPVDCSPTFKDDFFKTHLWRERVVNSAKCVPLINAPQSRKERVLRSQLLPVTSMNE